jgi:peptidoglycan/LPS O-acetylase OafA/YrhL
MMIWLGDAAQGRDNNFNLIRMLAASAVLVSHAWPMVYGDGAVEPLEALTGYSLGTFAVYVFFALSGFFISASFARSESVFGFVAARCLRLFPGLAVSLLLVALVMGPMVTSLSWTQYLAQWKTWTFLLRNETLVSVQYTLPGVFEANPFPAVEGSIWTLIQEAMCYGLVFLAGISGVLGRRRYMSVALVVYGLLWLWQSLVPMHLHPKLSQFHGLSLPFVMGMTFWLWRDRIPLSVVGIAGLLAGAYATRATPVGFAVLMVFLTYTTFWLGHVPQGWLRRYNGFGDYSYGLYIYAFPVQGLAVWLFGPTTPAVHIALAFPVVLLLSVLSWQLVEKPALDLRHSVTAWHLARGGRERAETGRL